MIWAGAEEARVAAVNVEPEAGVTGLLVLP